MAETALPLTERQSEVLAFIVKYRGEHGISPSIREIAESIGVVSTNGVECHLKAMVKKGVIDVYEGVSRGIVPTLRSVKVKCPCCGEKFEHQLK